MHAYIRIKLSRKTHAWSLWKFPRSRCTLHFQIFMKAHWSANDSSDASTFHVCCSKFYVHLHAINICKPPSCCCRRFVESSDYRERVITIARQYYRFRLPFDPLSAAVILIARYSRGARGVNGDANYTINVANANTYAK